jgi:hypothetical protein
VQKVLVCEETYEPTTAIMPKGAQMVPVVHCAGLA